MTLETDAKNSNGHGHGNAYGHSHNHGHHSHSQSMMNLNEDKKKKPHHHKPSHTLASLRKVFGSTISHDGDEHLSHLDDHEKMDQVVTKMLSELQKVDEFYRLMEHKLVVAFESLNTQVPNELERQQAISAAKYQKHAHGHHGHGHHDSVDTHIFDALPLRAAFIHLLRRATMLIHFVDINYMAFVKLLKVSQHLLLIFCF
jgi:hypothetical protein